LNLAHPLLSNANRMGIAQKMQKTKHLRPRLGQRCLCFPGCPGFFKSELQPKLMR
jgi:hypothetical protein